MKFTAKGVSDTGKVRENNEDQFFIDNQSGIFIVSDGMGGVEGGEVASKIVVDELPKLIRQPVDECADVNNILFQGTIQGSIQSVNNVIYREGTSRELRGMGATLVLVIVKKNTALIAHVGDSRCYYVNEGSVKLLTEDHVMPSSVNTLIRVMGSEEVVQADVKIVDLDKKSGLLLCSDGLNHMISDEEIKNALTEPESDKACYALIEKANQAGGEDNITVVLVKNEV